MEYTNLSARVEVNDKRKFEDFCRLTGINTSVAVNIFIKTVLRENRIPFTIQSDPFYSDSNMKALEKSIKQKETGKTVTKTLKELQAMENE